MASTYDNSLRLELIATGEAASTWGDKTNVNLTAIAAAFGYATQDGFAADANATTTVADGAADPARALYFKITSSATLTATRTLTIAPNTISRVMWIENATTGGQSIAISQGTGANVTIPTGKTAVVYLDGAGAGAAVVDAMASLNIDGSITAGAATFSGDVGIGAASPARTLEITSADTVAQRWSNTGVNNYVEMGTTGGSVRFGTSSGAFTLLTGGDAAYAGEVVALTIASTGAATFSGNVGVGVVPSAWGSLWKVSEIGLGASFGGRTNGTQADVYENLYRDATNVFKYKTSAAASLYTQVVGNFIWSNAGVGTAGATATVTERMRIDGATGNVGIGRTSNIDYLLDVQKPADAYIRISSATTQENAGIILANQNGTKWIIEKDGPSHDLFIKSASLTAMTISQAGNLGLGVTPSASAEPMIEVGNAGSSFVGRGPADTRILSGLYFNTSGTYKYTQSGVPAGEYSMTNGYHAWSTAPSGSVGAAASPVTGMLLNASGVLCVGVTGPSNANSKIAIGLPTSGVAIETRPSNGNGYYGAIFYAQGGAASGYIYVSATATSFSQSSDYRLKEDAVPMTGATERVKALRPINFAWKVDGSRVDGFLAHEAQEVVPEAVHGSKDAMRDEEYEVTPAVEEVRDEDGNVTTEAVAAVMGTRSVPDYQGIDQSKLVPLLTATIQELIARIEALEGA